MKALRILLVLAFLFSFGAVPASVAAQTGVPVGVEITSATLFVYVVEDSPQLASVHRVTADWVETEVTWNTFGSSFAPEAIDTFVPADGWASVDVTSLAQDWIDGSQPNYGVLLSHQTLDETGVLMAGYHSSEAAIVELRPRLEICYVIPGSEEQCITVQRAGAEAEDVFDTTVRSNAPGTNFGTDPLLYTRFISRHTKYALLRFEIPVEVLRPGVTIVKYTNGVEASDPNGADVPLLNPGDAVEWTYRITNTGETAVPREQITVTDNQPGVSPVFEAEVTGDGDTVFEPGEVWDYHAMGTAVDLTNPPDGMLIVENACTLNGTAPGTSAYVNEGTVTIPGATDSAESHYCNTTDQEPYKYWVPMAYGNNILIEPEDFQVNVGYEDLPLLLARNDYDYNDWVVEITFIPRRLAENPDLIDQITFDFVPGARGSVYSHAFSIIFPAGTFDSNGTTTLTMMDGTGTELRSTSGTYRSANRAAFQIFSNTQEVFPVNQTNTFESSPMVTPARTATLTITFDEPVEFSAADFSLANPHGEGLFFEPQIRVLNTGNVIGRGDLRMLTSPQFQWTDSTLYQWPEEYARIDRVYPLVTFRAGNPPVITFPEGWWTEHNNCAYDGLTCTAIP